MVLVRVSAPPRVESLSYVGGDRRRQEVADVREVLGVAHAFTLPRARHVPGPRQYPSGSGIEYGIFIWYIHFEGAVVQPLSRSSRR